MAASKPTILFVPGAWHKSTCYAPVMKTLNDHGYPTATAELASVGAIPGLETWADDISNISSALCPLVEAGKSVIVVTHSYSSLPAGEAIKPYLVRTRAAAGKKGGVAHLVFISAFVLPRATSLMDALGVTDLPWFDVSASQREVEPRGPADVFYNDLPAAEQRRHIDQLQTFSYQIYFQKTTWAPHQEVASSFVFCTRDNAIPLPVQLGMVKGSGVQFLETTIEAGHSPFLSRAEEVVGAIERAAESVLEGGVASCGLQQACGLTV